MISCAGKTKKIPGSAGFRGHESCDPTAAENKGQRSGGTILITNQSASVWTVKGLGHVPGIPSVPNTAEATFSTKM